MEVHQGQSLVTRIKPSLDVSVPNLLEMSGGRTPGSQRCGQNQRSCRARPARARRRRPSSAAEREIFIDNLLVRIHYIIVMIKWTGLAPWEFVFPFPVCRMVQPKQFQRMGKGQFFQCMVEGKLFRRGEGVTVLLGVMPP